ncbi:SURF1 family protein [Jannaschia pohangensis]|uniref:SURF1-like protein n=1 Tax=Jannaschia pohangensis TaxID=390807 RepID=A0A1I3QF24_9RHOB|nr:SURF1 family protein [Jannaschia pohangensis]SFJ32548.1 surfeit locus 1 family protein [Jannaschia pohangensis]
MRLILPLLFGLGGFAVLVALGLWQVQRLDWKEGVIAEIEGRIGAAPVALPAEPDPDADNYLPVVLTGTVAGPPLRVLGSWRGAGTGFRIVVPLETDGRRIMVDLGVVPLDFGETIDLPDEPLAITGNLNWPDDQNDGTPPPEGDLWYARDLTAMAPVLGTEPVMVVARSVAPETIPLPTPVGVEGIPNSHLGYAIQWFGLALVWLGMTVFLLWRIRRRTI